MDSNISSLIVPVFIKLNNIDMSEFETEHYNSFNDFFTRRIKPEKRIIDMNEEHLISPSDGYLSVYSITPDTTLSIKKSLYTISELIRDDILAKEFENGTCLVFRLCPEHYHRYIHIDNGKVIYKKRIEGLLHTVRPIALHRYNVFSENTREYTVIKTDHFDKIIHMEIGAMMVGKIDNYPSDGNVLRGQEKGKFLFGGSTIVLLLKSGVLSIRNDNAERPVKVGQWIH